MKVNVNFEVAFDIPDGMAMVDTFQFAMGKMEELGFSVSIPFNTDSPLIAVYNEKK